MKASEFYERYWRVIDANGKAVKLPPLRQEEKDFLDHCAEVDNVKSASFYRKRGRSVYIDVGILKEKMKKFPAYFIPTNQPLLDKYGGIIESPKD